MRNNTRRAVSRAAAPRVLAALATAATLLVVAGCGNDDGLGRRYSVTGKVTYKGEPVKEGNIIFDPASPDGRHASGTIKDGYYKLSTLGNDDGAFPGKYKVAVIAKDVDTSKVLANAGGGAGRHDDIYKASKAAKNLVPTKYNSSQKSGLEAEVEAKSNTKNFDLTD